jgi:hypothetical protein
MNQKRTSMNSEFNLLSKDYMIQSLQYNKLLRENNINLNNDTNYKMRYKDLENFLEFKKKYFNQSKRFIDLTRNLTEKYLDNSDLV